MTNETMTREQAEAEVLKTRGSYDAPGFDACVDAILENPASLSPSGDAPVDAQGGGDDSRAAFEKWIGEPHEAPWKIWQAGWQAALASRPVLSDELRAAEQLIKTIEQHISIADGWEDGETFYEAAVQNVRDEIASSEYTALKAKGGV